MITKPEPLSHSHTTESFDCGESVLDDWLRKRALANQESGASRTYVVGEGKRVVGYYCLSAGAVGVELATGRVRRNMPDPVPVLVLGRLAIDKSWQGKGLGRLLLRDAVLRAMQVAHIAGVRALLVHALNDNARSFYESCGFQSSPVHPSTLMVLLADAQKALEAPRKKG